MEENVLNLFNKEDCLQGPIKPKENIFQEFNQIYLYELSIMNDKVNDRDECNNFLL